MGRWGFDAFERTSAEHMKTLFYKASGQAEYDVGLECKYRAFIKNLDTNDTHVVRQFRRLIDAQNRANEAAEKAKDGASTSAPRWRSRMYGDHAESSLRETSPSRRNGTSRDGTGAIRARTNIVLDDSLLPLDPVGVTHAVIPPGDSSQDPNAIWVDDSPDGLDSPDPWSMLGGDTYYGYQESTTTATNIDRRESASPTYRLHVPRTASHSPPLSLSHERRRAGGEGEAGTRPIARPEELDMTYNLPPEGFEHIVPPGLDAAADDPFTTVYVHTGEYMTPPLEPNWMQAARDEIRDESRFDILGTRLPWPLALPPSNDQMEHMMLPVALEENVGMARTPSFSLPSITARPDTAASSYAEHIRSLDDPATLPHHDVPSATVPRPLRRRRIHLQDIAGRYGDDDGETTMSRNVRRRLTSGDQAVNNNATPITASTPDTALGSTRMQRQRRSMPPMPARPVNQAARARDRDSRRDGIVWDVDGLDDVFDSMQARETF